MVHMNIAAVLAVVSTASAHFGLTYPEWRVDSLAELDDSPYSQWTYPCANASFGEGNVTDWPVQGGSLKLELHHPWTYVFVNLGLGNDTTNFNITLTPQFWNVTGKGTLCVDKLPIPDGTVNDGDFASLQVVTLGESGNALYNCADIRFSKDAKALDNCTSSDGLELVNIKEQKGNDSSDGDAGAGADKNKGGDGKDDEKSASSAALGANGLVVVGAAVFAAIFALEL